MATSSMPSGLPPLYALQAFVVAARVGSFTGAAEQLHLTQSAVSRQVQLLEDYFGCPLFVRQARGLSLTREGKDLLPEVVEAMASLVRASARIKRSMDALSVQLPPTFSLRWFLPRLPKLKAALPALDVRVATHWTDAPDFSRADVDVIVAHGDGSWTNVHAVPVMREMLLPYCSAAVAATLGDPALRTTSNSSHRSSRPWPVATATTSPTRPSAPNKPKSSPFRRGC
ncbi:LysR family transcriptional regulator [Hydrogenophaga sp. 2FB]|uniref:LysR family transcriptional regulator n=1 Tax=Hydrogenophaga sp. 2FB TaxID=2502187 RepID=UPI00148590A9|nr:LysR family transcriptional regulator [Hydrogenophaga sp. 2FB]